VVMSFWTPLSSFLSLLPHIWIAALALEHQLPLAARDAHFDLVFGLTVLKW